MISNRNACGQNLSQVAGEEFVPLRLLLSIEQLAAMQIMGHTLFLPISMDFRCQQHPKI